MRTNLLGQFGALNDPDKAIQRINAYYAQLSGAAFGLLWFEQELRSVLACGAPHGATIQRH